MLPPWEAVVYEASEIAIAGGGSVAASRRGPITISTSRPGGFTLRDMVAAIEMVERRNRLPDDWCAGMDTHHVNFEGMRLYDKGEWGIF
ncbi:hypothetical protein TeGR_g3406 [Tetraparma gracilis]|uniref:Uncharacterized protein n=1 Tax=Tetraparma gracilis TaxID=2962635 RepID=A0ABQ6MX01_9STRA|nr:hypothetical protein TeGR_g3406 [Tetraparma gracilis]